MGLGIRGWRRVGLGICKVGGVGSRSNLAPRILCAKVRTRAVKNKFEYYHIITQNAYFLHFLEGHLSSLHSRLTQESPKPCQMNVSSTLKKYIITRLRN